MGRFSQGSWRGGGGHKGPGERTPPRQGPSDLQDEEDGSHWQNTQRIKHLKEGRDPVSLNQKWDPKDFFVTCSCERKSPDRQFVQ